jgi:pimeloyl-ACP methyl ester carboxylesterase
MGGTVGSEPVSQDTREDDVAGHSLDIDEFSGLADEASEFGISVDVWPRVRREDTHTPDGLVSSLLWGIGPPEVVFLHGGGLNAHTWDAVALALGRPALAVDLPGHGHSAWRDDGRYEPRILATAVATVVERFAPDALAVVGQSLGGFTAIALADMREDLVRRQILVDAAPTITARSANPVTSFLDGPDSFASRQEIVDRALAFGFGASRGAVERGVALNTLRRDDGRWVWRHHMGQSPATVAPLGDFAALWPSLAAFPGPVTLVRAARGFISDEQVAVLSQRVPTAEIVTVETGHNVQEDDPVGLAQLIAGRLGPPGRLGPAGRLGP